MYNFQENPHTEAVENTVVPLNIARIPYSVVKMRTMKTTYPGNVFYHLGATVFPQLVYHNITYSEST